MNESDRDETLRRELKEWDPAEHFGPPRAPTVARARLAMLDAMARPATGTPWLAWVTAALVLVLAAIAWQVGGPRWDPGNVSAAAPLRVQFQASNGTRIFWTIHAARAVPEARTGKGESHDEI